MSAQREKGPVKWFDKAKGFGFITRTTAQGTEDVFVHYNAIQGDGFRLLYEGQIVEYSVQKGPKGLQAENVILTNEEPLASSEPEQQSHEQYDLQQSFETIEEPA